MRTPEELKVIEYVTSGRFKKDILKDKKHANHIIAKTIASDITGKHLTDTIEYYLNTIDELEEKLR